MDHPDPVLKSEVALITLIANFGFQNGWMTEIENLQITTKMTLDLKKLAFFEILRNTKCDKGAAKLLCALRCVDEMKLDHRPCSDTLDEDYYLFIVMSKLYTNNLITKKHKLIYENRLREKRIKKNADQREKLEKGRAALVKSGDTQREDEGKNVGYLKNPMLIDLIIQCLMQYLSFEQVKTVRYISQVWGLVGLDVLKVRSKIEFSLKTYSNCNDRTSLNFLSTFPIEKLKKVHFTNFSFGNPRKHDGISKTWAIKELDYFFRNHRKYIKELDIDILQLVDENGRRCDNYDISSWLHNSAMTKPNTNYNTRFKICDGRFQNHKKESTMIFIQLSVLANIKELLFWNCGVNIQEGILIVSLKIQLVDVCFHNNGNRLSHICVNDIVDFTKTKEVILTLTRCSSIATKMILDMDRNPETKLEALALSYITLENLGNCRWSVNHLQLYETYFTESSEMKIRELTITHNFFPIGVDISILPQSIETLSITQTSNCVCSQPIVLQNLKTLNFEYYHGNRFLEFLNSQTIKCPQLVELHLEHNSYLTNLNRLDMAWIPQTLKILKLKGICINDQGIDNNVILDKLILKQYNFDDVGNVCNTKVKTKNLVLSYERYGYLSWNVDHFLTFLNSHNNCQGLDQRIYVGHFNLHINQFQRSPLRDYVDKQAEYYLFKNKIGKAIDYKQFEMVHGNATFIKYQQLP